MKTAAVIRTGWKPLAEQPLGLAVALGLVNAVLGAALVYGYFAHGLHPEVFLRDPNALAGQPEYYGLLSNLAVLGWTVTATVALFAWLLLRRRGANGRFRNTLLYGGLLTAVAAVDDLFMLHDGFAEWGGLQNAVLLSYAFVGVVWLARSAREVAAADWLLLLLGMGGLAASVVLDLGLVAVRGEVLLEDMAKLAGIMFWSAFFLATSWRAACST